MRAYVEAIGIKRQSSVWYFARCYYWTKVSRRYLLSIAIIGKEKSLQTVEEAIEILERCSKHYMSLQEA